MKRFLLSLLLLLSITAAAATVKVSLKISNADTATFPATAPDTTAEVVYVSSLNPNPLRYSVVGTYTAATGTIEWTVPANSYFRVGCSSLIGMWPPRNYSIGTTDVLLNDVIPAGTVPDALNANYIPYSGATRDANLGSKNVTTTGKGTFGTFRVTTGAGAGTYLAGDASGNGTWAIFPTYEVPLTFSSPLSRVVNTISIPVATASVDGYLSHADWSTFNGKAAGSHTHSSLVDGTHADWVLIWEGGALGGVRADQDNWTINGAFNQPLLWSNTNQKGTARTIAHLYDNGVENDTEFLLKGPTLAEGSYVTITFPGVTGTLWGSGNDGTGSGLDADLLDGHHYGDFVVYSGSNQITLTNGIGQTVTHGYSASLYRNTTYKTAFAIYPQVLTFFQNYGEGTELGIDISAPDVLTDYRYIKYPDASGTLWCSGNDGTGSGLDADTVDGDHASAFLKAEADTFQTVLARNATATTSPKAPRFLSTEEYCPDDPPATAAPSGWPNDGTAADSKDEEFNGALTQTFATYGGGGGPSGSLTAFPGFLQITTGNGPYYMVDLGAGGKLTGDFDVAISFKLPGYGSQLGLALATDEATPKTYVASQYWGGSGFYNYRSAKNVGWVSGDGTVVSYVPLTYYRIKRVSNEITFYCSQDGFAWTQINFRDVATSSNVYYISETNPIQYYGVYFTINGGSAIHAPAGTIYSLVNWIRWK